MFKIGYYSDYHGGLKFEELGYVETEEMARKFVAIGNNNCRRLTSYLAENYDDEYAEDIEVNELGQPCHSGFTGLYMHLMTMLELLDYKKISNKEITLRDIFEHIEEVDS